MRKENTMHSNKKEQPLSTVPPSNKRATVEDYSYIVELKRFYYDTYNDRALKREMKGKKALKRKGNGGSFNQTIDRYKKISERVNAGEAVNQNELATTLDDVRSRSRFLRDTFIAISSILFATTLYTGAVNQAIDTSYNTYIENKTALQDEESTIVADSVGYLYFLENKGVLVIGGKPYDYSSNKLVAQEEFLEKVKNYYTRMDRENFQLAEQKAFEATLEKIARKDKETAQVAKDYKNILGLLPELTTTYKLKQLNGDDAVPMALLVSYDTDYDIVRNGIENAHDLKDIQLLEMALTDSRTLIDELVSLSEDGQDGLEPYITKLKEEHNQFVDDSLKLFNLNTTMTLDD